MNAATRRAEFQRSAAVMPEWAVQARDGLGSADLTAFIEAWARRDDGTTLESFLGWGEEPEPIAS